MKAVDGRYRRGISECRSLFSDVNLEESDPEFGSDTERDPDSRSTTSLEDISKLHPDMLLYKATRARNLPVMLEAIALGANINWQNEEDEGRTPLIQAVQSVRRLFPVSLSNEIHGCVAGN